MCTIQRRTFAANIDPRLKRLYPITLVVAKKMRHPFILVRIRKRKNPIFVGGKATTRNQTSAATMKFIEGHIKWENDAVIQGRLPTILETRFVVMVK